MEVRIAELANLYNHMEAHCNKTRLCMYCKYHDLCFIFEETIVEVDSGTVNKMREKAFGE